MTSYAAFTNGFKANTAAANVDIVSVTGGLMSKQIHVGSAGNLSVVMASEANVANPLVIPCIAGQQLDFASKLVLSASTANCIIVFY